MTTKMTCPICAGLGLGFQSEFEIKKLERSKKLKLIKCTRCKTETILYIEDANPLVTRLKDNTILINYNSDNVTSLFPNPSIPMTTILQSLVVMDLIDKKW
ncbi:MAG: hypothetical protein ACOCUI_02655 [bacterium]